MVFQCQKDSYLKEWSSKVVSCDAAQETVTTKGGKAEKVDGYEVVLENTILFPEGGGQPDDHGWLGEEEVLRVIRRGQTAVHFTRQPLEVGAEVTQKVDWTRRFDHMQQHSGQHLICAIAQREFGFPTTSWWLGDQVSYNEFDVPKITEEQMRTIERIANEKIREAVPVRVDVYQPDSPLLKEKKLEGLPEDFQGPVRMVVIEGVDEDRCCGTHVANLSHLQVVKVLHCEKGKKNKTNLHFLVGGRVLAHLDACLDREKQLTQLLKNGPADHIALVTKLQKSLKTTQKDNNTLLKDIAVLEAQRFKGLSPRPRFFSMHRKEAEADFMSLLINQIADSSVLVFLTVGDMTGAMALSGPEKLVQDLGPRMSQVLGGRGAGKGGHFQAKVANLRNRAAAEKMATEALKQQAEDPCPA